MTDETYISLFDSTLRDGAQTQGVDFAAADKIAISKYYFKVLGYRLLPYF